MERHLAGEKLAFFFSPFFFFLFFPSSSSFSLSRIRLNLHGASSPRNCTTTAACTASRCRRSPGHHRCSPTNRPASREVHLARPTLQGQQPFLVPLPLLRLNSRHMVTMAHLEVRSHCGGCTRPVRAGAKCLHLAADGVGVVGGGTTATVVEEEDGVDGVEEEEEGELKRLWGLGGSLRQVIPYILCSVSTPGEYVLATYADPDPALLDMATSTNKNYGKKNCYCGFLPSAHRRPRTRERRLRERNTHIHTHRTQ